MSRPAHLITLEPWRSLGFGERLALEAATALLWPLQPDDRMTVLLNLMAAQIDSIAENEDQIDALIEVLRMQLKLGLHHE
jgi:cellulose biosynthesis protein BcsQ